jgi:RimJ/RimL family protein N-acetyltransferase
VSAAVEVFEPAFPLETERLLLRAFTSQDFDALYAMQSLPEVARYLYWPPRTEAEVRTALEMKVAARAIRSEGDDLTMAVVLKATGELVGDVMLLWLSREHRQGEIGYIVHPDHQGRGYATEVARLLLRLAFEDLELHRVVGRLEVRNTASARVLERVGMRREAHLVENEYIKGEWQSEFVYAILEREWRGSER